MATSSWKPPGRMSDRSVCKASNLGLGPVYIKCQRQCCHSVITLAILLLLKTMAYLQIRLHPFF